MTTLYLDMDGVVADFDEYTTRTLGILPREIYPEEIWHKLASNPRLYKDLIPTPYATQLVYTCQQFCNRNKYDLKFLTAVPKNNDIPWVFNDKVYWARNYFATIPVMFGPYSKDKYHHCQTGDILIDDRLTNIQDWIAAGGIAIHHKNIDTTLQQLSNLL